MSRSKPVDELVFKVIQESDGGYVAQCLTESIVTQDDTWDELKEMLRMPSRHIFSKHQNHDPFACTWFEMKCCRWDENSARP
jgi:hypothetical protein